MLLSLVVITIPAFYAAGNRPQHAFVVDVQMPYYEEMTNDPALDLFMNGGALPVADARRRGLALPNVDTFLEVALDREGHVSLGGVRVDRFDDTSRLRRKLRRIFDDRDNRRVLDEKTGMPLRSVILRAPRSAKYGDLVRIVDALKTVGADPIMLQIDGLAN